MSSASPKVVWEQLIALSTASPIDWQQHHKKYDIRKL
jgi:hypothetical protein